MSLPVRGEIWAVDLNPTRGHEQAGRRPCLVISDDIYNLGPATKHIVLPVTSRNKGIPYHLPVQPPEGGLRVRSYVMCDDVRSVSRERFGERLGEVSKQTLELVKESLETLLGF
jgi:mRNA interferase MazF